MKDPASDHALYYSDQLINALELRWGDGHLSPGGEAELAHMFAGLDVTGTTGLDFGCGVGGYDVTLVRGLGAARVVGIDLGENAIREANARARREALGDRLEFRVVTPGPLPFDDAVFDFVLSKDAVIDVPSAEKGAVFAELYRVCRPGGRLVIGDWFRSEDPYTEEMRRWATEGEETYEMETLAGAARFVVDAGFVDVVLEDRGDWFREYARDEYERMKGPLFPEYVARFGEASARSSLENSRIRALLAEQGQLRPGHLRATKPAA